MFKLKEGVRLQFVVDRCLTLWLKITNDNTKLSEVFYQTFEIVLQVIQRRRSHGFAG